MGVTKGTQNQAESDPFPSQAPWGKGGGLRSCQLFSGSQQVKFSSVTLGSFTVPAPLELPRDVPWPSGR